LSFSRAAAAPAVFLRGACRRSPLRLTPRRAALVSLFFFGAAAQASVGHIAHREDLAQGVSLPWQIITENVSQNGNVGYAGAHRTLMNSPGHRANILNVRVNRVGMGVARKGAWSRCVFAPARSFLPGQERPLRTRLTLLVAYIALFCALFLNKAGPYFYMCQIFKGTT
jgi:hypothetical protein